MPDTITDPDKQCMACEYSFTGLPKHGRCPNCGDPYDFTSRVTEASFRDVQCSKCNYSLKGLADEGNCPECGNAYNINQRIGIRSNYIIRDRMHRRFRRFWSFPLFILAALFFFLGSSLALMQGMYGSLLGVLFVSGTFLLAGLLLYMTGKPIEETEKERRGPFSDREPF